MRLLLIILISTLSFNGSAQDEAIHAVKAYFKKEGKDPNNFRIRSMPDKYLTKTHFVGACTKDFDPCLFMKYLVFHEDFVQPASIPWLWTAYGLEDELPDQLVVIQELLYKSHSGKIISSLSDIDGYALDQESEGDVPHTGKKLSTEAEQRINKPTVINQQLIVFSYQQFGGTVYQFSFPLDENGRLLYSGTPTRTSLGSKIGYVLYYE